MAGRLDPDRAPAADADLLGKGTSVLDNNTFYISRPWAARYRAIRNSMVQDPRPASTLMVRSAGS